MASKAMSRHAAGRTWSASLQKNSRSISSPFLQRLDRQTTATPITNTRRLSYTPLRNDTSPAATPKPKFVFTKPPHQPPPPTERNDKAQTPLAEPITEITKGLPDAPADSASGNREEIDWTRSFSGLSSQPFSKEAGEILMASVNPDDIEIKPDGIIYMPEIKYRRILNRAFGPGGWGLAPRGETTVTPKSVTREYALLAHGRLVSVARGEQDYFDSEGIPTATEGCKSNALMRCCKDLGVASELWDPRFIRKFLADNSKEVWVEHTVTKKKRKITIRKDDTVRPPYKLS